MRNHLHTEYYKYINNLLEPENDSSSKYFWKYINSRKQDSVSIGTLKDNDNIAESAKEKAEMFNSQFCSVFLIKRIWRTCQIKASLHMGLCPQLI